MARSERVVTQSNDADERQKAEEARRLAAIDALEKAKTEKNQLNNDADESVRLKRKKDEEARLAAIAALEEKAKAEKNQSRENNADSTLANAKEKLKPIPKREVPTKITSKILNPTTVVEGEVRTKVIKKQPNGRVNQAMTNIYGTPADTLAASPDVTVVPSIAPTDQKSDQPITIVAKEAEQPINVETPSVTTAPQEVTTSTAASDQPITIVAQETPQPIIVEIPSVTTAPQEVTTSTGDESSDILIIPFSEAELAAQSNAPVIAEEPKISKETAQVIEQHQRNTLTSFEDKGLPETLPKVDSYSVKDAEAIAKAITDDVPAKTQEDADLRFAQQLQAEQQAEENARQRQMDMDLQLAIALQLEEKYGSISNMQAKKLDHFINTDKAGKLQTVILDTLETKALIALSIFPPEKAKTQTLDVAPKAPEAGAVAIKAKR